MPLTVWKAVLGPLPLVLLVLGGSARAEPIPWGTDYTRAREDSRKENRPLILSVERKDCAVCRKLQATTCQDAALVQRVRAEFVALRVEAETSPELVQAIQVDTFPTVIFAAPDGKVLHAVSGYVDAPAMGQHIQKALALWQESQEQATSAPLSPGPGDSPSAAVHPVSTAEAGSSAQPPASESPSSPVSPHWGNYPSAAITPGYTSRRSC
jgi:hypothetical protein